MLVMCNELVQPLMTTQTYTDPTYRSEKEYQAIKKHPRIKRISDTTIQIAHEDHTLMNLLQHVLMQRPFILAGYVIPHLSEDVVELSILGKDGMQGNVFEWTCEGLSAIEDMGHVFMQSVLDEEKRYFGKKR